MTPRLSAAAVLAVAVVVAKLTIPPAGATAATPVIGWWSQAPGDALTAGPAPAVPAGGLYVANGPTAAAAISALRVDGAGAGEGTVRVTLALAPDATASTTSIAACPTTRSWTPANGGSLDQAPTFDCTLGAALGTVDTNASTVTWILPPSFAHDGAVDVALVPAAGAAPFNAPFQAPADGAVDVAAPETPPASPDESPAATDQPTATPSAGGAAAVGTPPLGDVPSFAPAPADPSVAPAASSPSAPASRASAPRRAARPIAVTGTGAADRRGPRILAVALLLALAAGCYRLSVMQPRPLRAIVTLRSATRTETPKTRSRGIGRYARPRDGRPRGV